MTTWLLRRLMQAALVVLAMTVIVFIGVNVIGDPVEILISPEADQAERIRAIAALGLDKPLWQQYLYFCGARCTAILATASCLTNRHCG